MTNVEQRDGISRTAQTVPGNGTFSKVLKVRGGRGISGIIDKSGSYDVDLVWLDNEGNEIVTENIKSGVSGQTEFSEEWHSVNKCRVEITDNSGTADDASITVSAV